MPPLYLCRCGHCKRLKPEYYKAGELLRGNENGIALAMVDCTEGGKETCSKHSVSGYPTLKIFKNGAVSADYNGPREAGKLIDSRMFLHVRLLRSLNSCAFIID